MAGALSSLSVLNNYVTCSSRELYCASRHGLIPFSKWLVHLTSFKKGDRELENSPSHVPFRAILIVSVAPFLLSFLKFEQVIIMGSFLIAMAMFF